jgi:hypothetical protein
MERATALPLVSRALELHLCRRDGREGIVAADCVDIDHAASQACKVTQLSASSMVSQPQMAASTTRAFAIAGRWRLAQIRI